MSDSSLRFSRFIVGTPAGWELSASHTNDEPTLCTVSVCRVPQVDFNV